MKKVTLKCSIKGCPRKRKINFDKTCFPTETEVVTLRCPWHDNGDFDTEQYYDAKGNELFWQPDEDK